MASRLLVLLADGGVVPAAAVQPQADVHAAGAAGGELPGERGRADQETGPAGVDAVLQDLGVEHPDPDDREIRAPGETAAGAADQRDPYLRPHVQVEQGGGIRGGHHLVRARRVGPCGRATIVIRSWAGVQAVGAGDACAASCTCASRTVPRFPRGVRVAAVSGTAAATPLTCGSRASWRRKPGE